MGLVQENDVRISLSFLSFTRNFFTLDLATKSFTASWILPTLFLSTGLAIIVSVVYIVPEIHVVGATIIYLESD